MKFFTRGMANGECPIDRSAVHVAVEPRTDTRISLNGAFVEDH